MCERRAGLRLPRPVANRVFRGVGGSTSGPNRYRLSEMHLSRLRSDLRRRRGPRGLPPLRQPAGRGLRLGRARPCRRPACGRSSRSGPAPAIRCASAACGGSTNCCRLRRRSSVVTVGEGQTLLQQADGVAAYVGVQPGPAVPAVRGAEPVGQLQGQRHVGGLHATPGRSAPSGRPAPRPATPAPRWPCTARSPG